MKTEVIPFKSFVNGTWNQKVDVDAGWGDVGQLVIASGSILAITLPNVAMAAGGDTFSNLHVSIMNMFDSGVVLIIIFGGACWCLGHRGKALEIIIGTAAGYLLARHAVDIRDFLKGI